MPNCPALYPKRIQLGDYHAMGKIGEIQRASIFRTSENLLIERESIAVIFPQTREKFAHRYRSFASIVFVWSRSFVFHTVRVMTGNEKSIVSQVLPAESTHL
jgi:hypothetical protein